MRVLLVDAFGPEDPDGVIVAHARSALQSGGHEVEHHRLAELGFDTMMSADERRAYETESPLLAPETRAAAAAVQACEAMLFCYPTTLGGVPALLKSWLERVMVRGVAFEFGRNNRLRPAMTNVRRLGIITTVDPGPQGREVTAAEAASSSRATAVCRARSLVGRQDAGYLTIHRTLRLNCHRWCRRTTVHLPTGRASAGEIATALGRWR